MRGKSKHARSNPDTTLIAIESDKHAGSTVALMPPEVPLDDGNTITANKAQLWAWEKYQGAGGWRSTSPAS
ncbi:MAG TPA: hypothetical protein VKD22_15470, partial [Ramlibacter sp.]|nr:hypothetical protein [Ramlibacter sp.]